MSNVIAPQPSPIAGWLTRRILPVATKLYQMPENANIPSGIFLNFTFLTEMLSIHKLSYCIYILSSLDPTRHVHVWSQYLSIESKSDKCPVQIVCGPTNIPEGKDIL